MAWAAGVYTRTNGVYSGPSVWNSDKGAGVKIVTSRHDTHDEDLANGINNCLTKDGTNVPTANLPLGGYKHTGVGNATATDQYATYGQVRGGVDYLGTTAGTSSAYTLTPTVALSLATGTKVRVLFHTVSAITPTLNVSATGAIAIRTSNGQSLPAGVLLTGIPYELVYNGTYWLIVSPGNSGWTTWAPTYGGTGSLTFTSVTTNYALWTYDYSKSSLSVKIQATGTTGGVTNNELTATLPITVTAVGYTGNGFTTDVSALSSYSYVGSTTQLYVRRWDNAAYGLGAGRGFVQNIEIPYS